MAKCHLKEKISVKVERREYARPVANARLYPSTCAQGVPKLGTALCAKLDKWPSPYTQEPLWRLYRECTNRNREEASERKR